MKININNKGGRRFAPWTALLALSLLAAIVLVAPTVVFAQTYDLSQACETALVGTEHTITATVTNGDVPVQGVLLLFIFQGKNSVPPISKLTNEDGIAEITYAGSELGNTTIWLTSPPNTNVLGTIITEWTTDDLCSDSPAATVGGRVKLNAKKNGALRVALCSVDGLDVTNVDLKTVQLVGVAPWRSHYKDSRLCPDGKDGVGDLVFTFRNREVVEALENSLGELEDGQEVGLTLTGSMGDGTIFEGEWLAVIKKKGKRHMKEKNHGKKNHEEKKEKKGKVAKK